MEQITKNKKLYIVILFFVLAVITIYSISPIKTEAPQAKEEPIIKNINDVIPTEEKIENPTPPPVQKYKIVSRSIVAPKDITNKTKIVLLTIDDGPSKRTLEIVSILEKHNAKAIFFVNGMQDKNNPGIISQINESGFVVGNHGWSHLNLKKQSNIDLVEKEVNKNTNLITKLTGAKPLFFRAPYGESNQYLRNFIKDNGMIFMDWSGAAMDWNKSTIEKDVFVNNVMNNIHSGSIILIHEHPWSLANLDALLISLESKGYTYVDPKDIIE